MKTRIMQLLVKIGHFFLVVFSCAEKQIVIAHKKEVSTVQSFCTQKKLVHSVQGAAQFMNFISDMNTSVSSGIC